MQQEASRKLGFSAYKTMRVAQKLYEGINLNKETSGLITYMRTDGVQISQEAITNIREFISNEYGKNFIPESPRYLVAKGNDELALKVLTKLFNKDAYNKLNEIKLHLKGTDFQLKVWEALLTIPKGKLATYGDIAKKIEKPKASRAVGTAIGSNPIAYLIPCH